jgi:DNA-binding transcriptional MerR regulator/methylmalonyl-CoA mutase cobalamin-binding subunit
MDMTYFAPLTQAEAEHVTGLSREVLRKWEMRYQFPVPLRGERGQRLYAQADVQRLQLIGRLVHCGLRPGKVVHLPLEALQQMLASQSIGEDTVALVNELLASLAPGCAPRAVGDYLERLVNLSGLSDFVQTLLPAFNDAVGDAWAGGRLGVHMEHHYTEAVRQTLYTGLARLRASNAKPRVLITTLPGELHGLGAMGLQVALAAQGAHCVSLGTQTPVEEVASAAVSMEIGVVAISASVHQPPQELLAYLVALRESLPPPCRLWAGGRGMLALMGQLPDGIDHFQSVEEAVSAWRLLLHIS